MSHPPVLLLGAQRSGTTLLRWCLDAHPAVAIGPETGFLRAVDEIAGAPAAGRAGRPWTDGWAVDDEVVEAAFVTAFTTVFTAHAAAAGARRWGEKTPVNIAFPRRLARSLPDARLVGVVRHPLAVARSLARWGWETPRAVHYWRRCAQRLVQHADLGGSRFLLVRYEDLVDEPATVLRDVLRHVGEPWDPVVLDPRNAADAGPGDGGNVARPIDPARAWSWCDRVTDDDVALLRDVEELAWFGYAGEAAPRLDPLPSPAFVGVPVPDRPDSRLAPAGWRAPTSEGAGDEVGPAVTPSGPEAGRGRTALALAALRRHGVAGTARRLAGDVRRLGPSVAVRSWRRSLRG